MKTRLLKKLRKKASEVYAIRKQSTGFAVFKPKDDSYWSSSSSFNKAKEHCKDYMNEWINKEVIKLRVKYPRKKVVHYYPW